MGGRRSKMFEPDIPPNRAQRRAARGRGYNAGRLVLHRTRAKLAPAGLPRPGVEARRAERAARVLARRAADQ